MNFGLISILALNLKNMSGFIIRTELGELKGEFFEESAPETVKHFKRLVESGFYDGLTFFKHVPAILLQTGCPKNDGTGSSENFVKCELKGDEQRHKFGTLAMAHGHRDRNGSQFYICLTSDFVTDFDTNNTCFGKISDENRPVLSKLKKGDIIEEIILVDE